ncbi:MAG: ATP-binding cassette domain-containing protein [Candidatus Micrarchaeaceae archaeon]
MIVADSVRKSFKTYENKKGFGGFFRRKFYYKAALKGVSFSVDKGEIVALLGRNGSGKSTLIKLMAGILHPDSGSVRVLGMNPWKDRIRLAVRIGVVFGATHPQLFWDLPPLDTFNYIKELYGVDNASFRERLRYLIGMLGVEKVYKRQTRQLSLGERMKCEFVAAMLNMPEIVFMDEPTIGVDLPSRLAIRRAVAALRKRFSTTFVITTHVVDDISNVDRIILLDKGRKLFDGMQFELKRRYGNYAVLDIYSKKEGYVAKYASLGRVMERSSTYMRLAVAPLHVKERRFMAALNDPKISDYRLSEPGLSALLESLYASIDRKRR